MILSCERSRIKWSSQFVESEGFESVVEGNTGKKRKRGSFIISYRFFGGGGVSFVLSGGVWTFEVLCSACSVVFVVLVFVWLRVSRERTGE